MAGQKVLLVNLVLKVSWAEALSPILLPGAENFTSGRDSTQLAFLAEGEETCDMHHVSLHDEGLWGRQRHYRKGLWVGVSVKVQQWQR